MNPAGSEGKRSPQGNGVVGAGLEPHVVGAGGSERTGALFPPPFGELGYSMTHIPASGIHQNPAAGLGVDNLDPPGLGQVVFPRVVHRDGDDFMAGAQTAERLLPTFGDEVGEHHHNAPVAEQSGGVGEARGQVGAPAGGLECHQVTNYPERMPSAFAGRDHPLYRIGKEDRAHPVVVIGRG